MNDDFINSGRGPANEDKLAMMEYSRQLGFGYRDDSICVASYSKDYGYNTLCTPAVFDYFWPCAPVDIEFEHYQQVFKDPEVWRDGFPFIDALARTHATFAGFHGYPRPWLEKNPYLTRYAANRLGYWYFIEGVQLPALVSGIKNCIMIIFENRGYAPCYYKFDFKVKLNNKSTGMEYIQSVSDVDNRRWMPGQIAKERFKVNLHGIPAGEYDVFAGLFENGRPIQFAMQPELILDGYCRLGKVSVIDNA
jgi:hypothetical protein